ncbi:MAG: arginine--tRNA ligase [Planctomycetota bacterium]|nr:arginine--tRNA ligase [Planctomycetota bacterium]
MNILSLIRDRFRPALSHLTEAVDPLLEMIRPSQDASFGDYQANCAMPLGKQLGLPPREVAQRLIDELDVEEFCEQPEIAGPGFINLRLKSAWLDAQLIAALNDARLGVDETSSPTVVVIDYSSPNVAKPMHVGHIRSTVIGDCLARVLRHLGHQVIGDNHLGDWGTQFGMIIYGYKHFVDMSAYRENPVMELSRLYQYVNRLVEFHAGKLKLPLQEEKVTQLESQVNEQMSVCRDTDGKQKKKQEKLLRKLQSQLAQLRKERDGMAAKLSQVTSDPEQLRVAEEHQEVGEAVLQETVRLHGGDETNLALWNEFLPKCREEIQRVYERLDIHFDVEYGESFYHEQLAEVVDQFLDAGLARESEGAICVFLEDWEAPMIIRKKDGAFLYATTDLATIRYRMETWKPDLMLYVVDHRQSEHFSKLFTTARSWVKSEVEFRHVGFGTVLGRDGRPYRTRSGDTVGLESLLDEAVAKAHAVVVENDQRKPEPEMSEEERMQVARVVGHGAIKYADLSHNRTSDYEFDTDKMLALEGNTATYLQYSYARVQSIFRRAEAEAHRQSQQVTTFDLGHPAERALALQLLRFSEALEEVLIDFRPNQLTDYLFKLAQMYSVFFEHCPVLKAETDELRHSRLALSDLTSRAMKQGLALLGIEVVERM